MRKKNILTVILLAVTAVTLTSFASKSSSSRSELVQRNIDALVIEEVIDPFSLGGPYKEVVARGIYVEHVYIKRDGQIYMCDGERVTYQDCGETGGRAYCQKGASFLRQVYTCTPVYEAR